MSKWILKLSKIDNFETISFNTNKIPKQDTKNTKRKTK